MEAPAVFISYSHDSPEHKQWVLNLATRLRQSGVDAILDQWELGPGSDLPHFMEQGLSKSNRVLMICTERYVDKANAGAGGVGYEKMIVTAELLKQIGSNRVIPIIRQSGSVRLPTFLGSKIYIDLSNSDVMETGMDQLLRELLNAPLFVKPAIGSVPFQPVPGSAKPTNPSPAVQFMQAVASVYDRSSETGAIRTEWVREIMKSSKLYFDYAFDQALSLEYVHASVDRKVIWVKEEGRAFLMELRRNAGSA